MLKIENTCVTGWQAAIRGMRNPMNSWERSDSTFYFGTGAEGKSVAEVVIGQNDFYLMEQLVEAGTEHAKFLRYIDVTCDIIAPDYWFKEFSTYRVGVVENSTSTMHKIHAKEFTLDDFSHEHLWGKALVMLESYIIPQLNEDRELYLEHKEKEDWWQMIQLLPMSYNYRRTVHLNYAVVRSMYHQRKRHKLDEWRTFCEWVESLPYSELITI